MLDMQPDTTVIEIADNKHIYSEAKGKIRLGGQTMDALYVPALGRTNLLSTISVVSGGKSMTFTETDCILKDMKGHILMNGYVKGRMYLIDDKPQPKDMLLKKEVITSDIEMLHRRLGHRNYDDIRRLVSSDAVQPTQTNISKGDHPFCESCAKGKMKRSLSLQNRKPEPDL